MGRIALVSILAASLALLLASLFNLWLAPQRDLAHEIVCPTCLLPLFVGASLVWLARREREPE